MVKDYNTFGEYTIEHEPRYEEVNRIPPAHELVQIQQLIEQGPVHKTNLPPRPTRDYSNMLNGNDLMSCATTEDGVRVRMPVKSLLPGRGDFEFEFNI